MARTRATKGSSAAEATAAASASTTSRYTLPAESTNPPKLFILPQKATPDARIVNLQNPRHGQLTKYLVCPESGIYEFTRIAAPKSTPRSWLIESPAGTLKSSENDGTEKASFEAQVSKGADLYVATLVDPIFLLLPALAAKGRGVKASDPPKRMFLSSEDHFDTISEMGHLSGALRLGDTETLCESRMEAICDTVEMGGQKMFRLSEAKLLDEMVSKAKRMSENELPRSMEEKFVTKTLEAPILGVRSQAAPEPPSQGPSSAAAGDKSSQVDSQSSFSSTDSASGLTSDVSAPSTAATSVSDEPVSAAAEVVTSAITASPEVVKLQRLRVAFNFICAGYIAEEMAAMLKKELEAKKELVDFTPLSEYLEKVAKLRQEAAALRTLDYSQKRSRDEDDDDRAEKRRKREEEDKRKKASESRGVRDLKKVNTSGMKKLSEFFKKK
ncbi:hypothetical protein GQ53DRAFT_752015 [Thozetella sp. PMI_491]|nr:hypothetical protein GQ53DRAFT_752015 [Thozetella sp. PMI_491]